MGTDSIHNNCYIVCAYDKYSPYGRMVCSYPTLKEATDHIHNQKTWMQSKASWNILHIKDLEWIKPKD